MSNSQQSTYFDWAATAPLCEEASAVMELYSNPGMNNIGVNANANSLHSYGRAAFAALEDARSAIARALSARRPDEIVFTSGATEANNSALFGIFSACVNKKKTTGITDFTPHIITSEIEHDTILAPLKILERLGCEVTYLKPDRQGFIEVRALEAALKDSTILVSIQTANNEIGSIQPIEELALIAHKAGAFFHTDAVQALGKIPLNLERLGVDAASFSAHKIGGPKGVGALYLKTKTPFEPLLVGGGQERGKRSGTQNVAGIVGFAAACQTACVHQEMRSHYLRELRDELIQRLADLDKVFLTVDVERGSFDYLPTIVHFCIRGFESETLILRLDECGFAVSGGSACSSSLLGSSHVLRALNIPPSITQGSLRVSLGYLNQEDEIKAFVRALEVCVTGKQGERWN